MDIGSVWTQILTALVVGLLTAFAFQFLLTSLGIAVGLSVWSIATTDRAETPDWSEPVDPDSRSDSRSARSSRSRASADSPSQPIDRESKGSSGIGLMAGFGILLTVNTVLFTACFLAAKFSQAIDPISGAIEGVVIWSAYFLLLIWLSSTAMSSVVGAVLGATTGGFRQLISTIGTALNRSETDALPNEQQVLALQQEMQEMQAVLDPDNLRHLIETQLQTLPSTPFPSTHSSLALKTAVAQSPDSDNPMMAAIAFWQQVEAHLHDASPKELAPKRLDRHLQTIWQATQAEFDASTAISTEMNSDDLYNWEALHQILEQRHDLSEKKKTRILKQLQDTWTDFLDTLATNEPDQAASEVASEDAEDADESDSAAQSIAQLTTKLVQSASEASLDQLLANLPTLLQWLKTTMPAETPSLVPLILSIALDKIRSSMDSANGEATSSPASDSSASDSSASDPVSRTDSLIDYASLRQSLNRLLEGSSELATLNQSLLTQLETWRDRSLQQVDSIQQATQDRINAVKQQAQQRLDNTRKAAAAAAWWLVATAATGVVSSALAGALAADFNLSDLIFW
jgi:hypothetical protein